MIALLKVEVLVWLQILKRASGPGDAVRQSTNRKFLIGNARKERGLQARRTHATVENIRKGPRRPVAWRLLGVGGIVMVLFRAIQPVVLAQQNSGSMAENQGIQVTTGSHGTPDGRLLASSVDQDSGSIFGSVLGMNDGAISGAQLTLSNAAGILVRELVSGSNGEFAFSKLQPGVYKVSATKDGLGRYDSPDIPILAGEQHLLTKVVVPISIGTTEVRVSADQSVIAEEQVHIALEQRVLGVLPNFYSTYDWNAPPMGPRQKFELALRAVTDPITFVGAGTVAGFEQATNSFPGYGLGAQGYAKRYGAAYADDFIGRMMGSAVFPSVFHQDPRYFYKGSGSISSRALYALSSAIVCRGDSGRLQPNYSHVLGSFTAGGLSNLYYPSASRGVSLTILNGLIETAGNAGNNLLREFVFKRFTPKVPSYYNGQQ